MSPLRQRMLEDLRLRGLAPHTAQLYLRAVAEFARHFGQSPDQLGPEHIRTYQLHLLNKPVSYSTLTIVVSALRFFYRVTLGKDWAIERIPSPKHERRLPVVLSLAEVAQFFAAVDNLTAICEWMRPDSHNAQTNAECRARRWRKTPVLRRRINQVTCGV
jgi:integrase/recombinase XerD